MYDAQTIQMQGSTSTVVLSPWFPRGGDYLLYTIDVIKMSSSSSDFTLTVSLEDKNSSVAGDGGPVTSSSLAIAGNSSPMRQSEDVATALEELVRYKFTLAFGGASPPASTVTNWAIFRMLAPVWRDAV